MRLIASFFVFWSLVCAGYGQSISYCTRTVNKASFHAVIADLRSENVKVSGLLAPKLGSSRSAGRMVTSAHPDVAVCGTFFCTSSNLPVGGIVIEGVEMAKGARGSALVIDYFNQAKIFDTGYGQKLNTDGFRFMMRGGVRIMTAGKTTIYPADQKFRLSNVAGSAPRTAVGVTPENRLVILVTKQNVQLRHVATAMKSFGVRDAISFDGGGSTTLYYKGKMLVRPARTLTNLMVLYESPGAAWQTRPVVSK
ncbi:MAG: phosphodiester glycosidase family protein [Fimbriimonadales bacterium]